MKSKLQAVDSHSVLLSILMIVIGLILAIWPGHVMTTALKILGIALLASGGIFVFSWYRHRNDRADVLTLAEGLLMAVGGLVVLLAPKFLISIVPWIVGVVVLINGVINLAQALDQRRVGYERWTWSMALAILTIVLGLLVVANPFGSMELLVIAIGLIILYNGVSNLLIHLGYRKMNR